jgi:branched-chain amino acid transport system substrate-binding protein
MGTDDILGKALAEFAYGLGYKRMGILTVNDPYGTAFQDIVKKTFVDLGGEIPVEVVVDGNLPDYRPELKRIADANVDAIFAGTYANDLRLQFRQLTQLGWKGTAFNLYPSATELNLDQEGNDRLYGVEPAWLAGDPRGEEWAEEFRASVGKAPEFWHAVGYDALYLAAYGVASAADASGDSVRSAIREYTATYSGPTGPIELDDKYIRINPKLAFFKLVDGQYVRVEETK